MGHIHFSIQLNQETKWYIFSHAEYLQEAWLAEVNENDSTKIVKQFKCKKLQNCFRELKEFVGRLGVVKKITANEIQDYDLSQLEYLLLTPTDDRVLPVNEPKHRNRHFWNWLQNDSYITL